MLIKSPIGFSIFIRTATDYFHDIPNNQVISVIYQNPKYTCHSCDLLPGIKQNKTFRRIFSSHYLFIYYL